MSPKQNSWYWREWRAVEVACKSSGLPCPDRHDLHRRALGHDKSSKSFTNPEFDAVIAEFRTWSRDADLDAQLRPGNQPRVRMFHKLQETLAPQLADLLAGSAALTPENRLASAEAYILTIARSKYHTDDLTRLTDAQLRLLLIDTTRAISQKRKGRASTPCAPTE